MLPTTSTREGIERSPDTRARLKACRNAIQSLCSAPFNLTAMNSVIGNGPKLPKRTEALFWRHLFSRSRSKNGVFHQLLLVLTPSNFNVRVAKPMLAPNQSNKRHWGTNNTRKLPISITTGFSTVLAQYSYKHFTERVPVPRPNENKSGFWPLLELHTELAIRFHSVQNTQQDPWEH